MALPAMLEKKIRLLSRRPAIAESDGVDPSSGETIVISRASERLPQAFDEAEKQLRQTSGIVRVIAHGATLERTWPPWVRGEPRVILTEPGAFQHLPPEESTRELQTALRAWLDRVFGEHASEALYTSARARFLQTPIVTFPIAAALAASFPNAKVVSLDAANHTDIGGWDPELFESVLSRAGSRVELPFATRKPKRAWAARVALQGALALGGAAAWQVRDYVRAGADRERATAFVSRLLRGSGASAKALGRLSMTRRIPTEGAAITLEPHLWAVLSLATLDVLRGARTQEDATPLSTSSHDPPMEPRWRLPPRPRLDAKKILIVNRHGHADLVSDGVFRDRVFQEELLDVGRKLRTRGDLSFRWRPHPLAVDEAIAHGRAFFPEAELSRGRPLEEDAAWADVIITSWSMAVYESLFAEIPIVIQARSEMIGLPELVPFATERVFWSTEEGVAKVGALLDAIERAEDVLAPERRARDALFDLPDDATTRGEAFARATPRSLIDRTQ